MKVGDTIKDGDGNEWVVSQLWLNGEYTDYALFHRETGAEGNIRLKTNTHL